MKKSMDYLRAGIVRLRVVLTRPDNCMVFEQMMRVDYYLNEYVVAKRAVVGFDLEDDLTELARDTKKEAIQRLRGKMKAV